MDTDRYNKLRYKIIAFRNAVILYYGLDKAVSSTPDKIKFFEYNRNYEVMNYPMLKLVEEIESKWVAEQDITIKDMQIMNECYKICLKDEKVKYHLKNM